MAPTPHRASALPAVPDWLALRRKHEGELHDFQEKVDKSHQDLKDKIDREKTALKGRIEVARTVLLEKHIEEERLFWSEKGTTAAPKPKTSNGRVQKERAFSGVSIKIANAKSPASKAPSTTSQSTKPSKSSSSVGQFQTTQTPLPLERPTQKPKPVPIIVDLCDGDDDEMPSPAPKATTAAAKGYQMPTQNRFSTSKPIERIDLTGAKEAVPEFSIPSARVQFFGNSSMKFPIPNFNEFQLVKREESVLSQRTVRSPTLAANDPFTSNTLVAGSFPQPVLQNWSGHTPLRRDGIPSGPSSRAFESRPATVTPHTQPSPFASSVSATATRNSDKPVPGGSASQTTSQSELNKGDGDVQMGGVSQAPPQPRSQRPSAPNPKAHVPVIPPSSHKPKSSIRTETNTRSPTPAQGHASMPKPKASHKIPHDSFKTPACPASVAPNNIRRQCETPAPSQAPSQASLPSGQKRRFEIDLSSDESNFVPSVLSEDEESEGPSNRIGRRKPSSGNAVPKPQGRSSKKAKVSASKSLPDAKKYGFKPLKHAVEATKTRARPTSSSTAPPASSSHPMPSKSAPQAPIRPSVFPNIPPQAFRAPRAAARKANEKLSELAEDRESFLTDEAITEADEQEQRLRGMRHTTTSKSTMEQMGSRLRGMSITPTPSCPGERTRRESGKSWETWRDKRAKGDRVQAKRMAEKQAIAEDYESDLE